MEDPFLIYSLISMGSKKIALCLDKVGGQKVSPVGIEII
jgi:hypothetical protein